MRSEEVIDAFSLMFSCLFMAELLGSVFAFGFAYVLHSYSNPVCWVWVNEWVRLRALLR